MALLSRIGDTPIAPEVIRLVPARLASHYGLVPLRLEGRRLIVAATERCDGQALDDLRSLLGYDIVPVMVERQEIDEAIRAHYGVGADTVEQLLAAPGLTAEPSRASERPDDLERMAGEASVITFVNQLILQAYRDRATDIHIEPFAEELRVRFRIDGWLHPVSVPPTIRRFQPAILSRLKIMAQLDIGERRLPQDGRIKLHVGGQELDLRMSVLPTPHGETVDLRLLSGALLYSLDGLGFSPFHLTLLQRLIRQPHGILFVTGPTGSGKTTTLYACLHRLNTAHRKILTIEDPIEYLLTGITQMQVHPKIGFTFAQGLRCMLRHDPDVMMVGEVRDPETAEITIRSALTGHLVLSTLHTHDAAGGVTRLLDMGVEPYLVASSVRCFIAQRLVRLICRECREPAALPPSLAEEAAAATGGQITAAVFHGRGCERCKSTGYQGRTALYEFLPVTDELRHVVLRRAPSSEVKRLAVEQGMRTLRQDGWRKVLEGLTTPSEVARVASSSATTLDDAAG